MFFWISFCSHFEFIIINFILTFILQPFQRRPVIPRPPLLQTLSSTDPKAGQPSSDLPNRTRTFWTIWSSACSLRRPSEFTDKKFESFAKSVVGLLLKWLSTLTSSNWNLLSHRPHRRRRQLFNFDEESKSSLTESQNRQGSKYSLLSKLEQFVIENKTFVIRISNVFFEVNLSTNNS
jgi:hypothetical protein